MQYRKTAIALAAALAVAAAAATPASAAHWHHGWHHHGGWGWGAAAGFATGAIIGGALASPYYYGGYGYGPYVYDDAYAAGPAYGGDDAYCSRRYRSYDPASGTYLGYDGARHPCP